MEARLTPPRFWPLKAEKQIFRRFLFFFRVFLGYWGIFLFFLGGILRFFGVFFGFSGVFPKFFGCYNFWCNLHLEDPLPPPLIVDPDPPRLFRPENNYALISDPILINLVSLERADSAIHENGIMLKNKSKFYCFLTCFLHEVVSICGAASL